MRAARGAIVVLAVLAALGAPRGARASNGAAPIAAGAKQAGRAGAETGVADDALSGAVNPAALGEIPGLRIDAGAAWFISRYRYVNDRNDHLAESFDTFVPAVGASWDPSAEGGPFRIGLDVWVPVGGGGDDQLKTEIFPEGERENLSFYTLAVAPTFAFRATDWLSLGAQVQLLYTSIDEGGLVGSSSSSEGLVFEYRQPGGAVNNPPVPVIVNGQQVRYGEFLASNNAQDTNQSSRLDVTNASGIGFGGALGLLARPIEEVSIGLSYRFEGHVPEVKGKGKLDGTQAFAAASAALASSGQAFFDTYLPDGGHNGFQSNYNFKIEDFKIPAVLSAGVAWRPLPTTLLAFDFRWIQWSSAFKTQKITLSGGTNNDINAVNGGDVIRNDKPQDWHDQLVFAFGSAQRLTDWMVLRGGFNYGKSPIPPNTSGITTGHTEFHTALGLGFYVDRFDIDLAYVFAFPATMTIDNSKVSPDLNGTSVRAEQHSVYFQASVSF
jgi:long-chain fatty acid transport protein